MSQSNISFRKSYFFPEEQSNRLSAYVKQQQIIREIGKLELHEELVDEMIDKIIDCNDASIHRIHGEMKEKGIGEMWVSIQKLRMSKNKK